MCTDRSCLVCLLSRMTPAERETLRRVALDILGEQTDSPRQTNYARERHWEEALGIADPLERARAEREL
jgi:hypothetical protein